MKNSSLFFGMILFSSVLFNSCAENLEDSKLSDLNSVGYSKKPENIKLSDLKSACDYINAYVNCVEVSIELIDNRNQAELNADEKAYIEVLHDKAMEIETEARKNYDNSEVKECENFQKMVEKASKLDKFW